MGRERNGWWRLLLDAYAIPDFEMGSVPGRFELLHKVKEYLKSWAMTHLTLPQGAQVTLRASVFAILKTLSAFVEFSVLFYLIIFLFLVSFSFLYSLSGAPSVHLLCFSHFPLFFPNSHSFIFPPCGTFPIGRKITMQTHLDRGRIGGVSQGDIRQKTLLITM